MSYESIESSIDEGEPLSLYRFILNSTAWYYTSADHDVTTMNPDGTLVVWKSIAISDSGFQQSGEAVSDALTIVAPITCGPVQQHLLTATPVPIAITIFKKHESSPEIRARYSGQITQIDPSKLASATITCTTITASMQQDGLRLGWQRSCPYVLYDPLTCRANPDSMAMPTRVLNKIGYHIEILPSGRPQDWFAGGFIRWQHPVRGSEFRGIEGNSDNVLLIFGRVEDIYPGLLITAYPGCSRTSNDCINKFANYDNYGGAPAMPGKSPFDGDPVF